MSDIKIFERTLENVFLNESELNNLKSIIIDVVAGKISDKFLRKHILKTRIKMLKDILKLFPLLTESLKDTNKTSMQINTLQEELQERNALLELLGQRIHNICNRLKEKVQPAPG